MTFSPLEWVCRSAFHRVTRVRRSFRLSFWGGRSGRALKVRVNSGVGRLSTRERPLALGCGEQTSPTAPGDPLAPSFSVERTIEHFGFGFGDEHYLVILGATAENRAAFCATGAENWDAVKVLIVTRPDGSQKVGWQARDLHALAWNQPADACAESPDYTGTASLTNHDNDLDLSAHGADATGIISRGER